MRTREQHERQRASVSEIRDTNPGTGLSAGEPFRPRNGVHAFGFLAALIEPASFAQRSLDRRQVLGCGPARTLRLLPTDSILARSWIYVARPEDACPFAGRAI